MPTYIYIFFEKLLYIYQLYNNYVNDIIKIKIRLLLLLLQLILIINANLNIYIYILTTWLVIVNLYT